MHDNKTEGPDTAGPESGAGESGYGARPARAGHKSPTQGLVASEAVYRQAFQSLPVSLALLDDDGCVLDVNEQWRAFARANGGDPAGYVGTNYVDVCRDPSDPQALEVKALFDELLAGRRDLVEYEYPCYSPEGRRWFLMQACRHPHGGMARFAVLHLETTRWRLAEEAEHRRAETDALTGVVNRGAFEHRAEQMLGVAERNGSSAALLFVDMDYYKVINDAYGHELGDEVLVALAERLRYATRQGDLLARYGGDEFVILAEAGDGPSAESLAERLREAMMAPIAIGDYRFSLTCSQGIAIFPDHGSDLAALVHAADAAMYRAKRAGADHVAFA